MAAINYRTIITDDEFRRQLVGLMIEDQVLKVYSTRLLTSMDQELKEMARRQIKYASDKIRDDLRRQVVESAGKDLDLKLLTAKAEIGKQVRAEARELLANAEVIRGFLQQHEAELSIKSQKILTESKQELEGLYRDHLARIIQEDQYRTINAALIDDLKTKYHNAFGELHCQYNDAFNSSLNTWRNSVQQLLDEIRGQAAAVSNTYKLLMDVQEQVKTLTSNTNWALGLSCTALGLVMARIVIGWLVEP